MSYEHCEKHDCDATNGCPRCAELQAAAEHPRTADPRDPEFEQKLVELWRSSGAIFHNATVAGVAAELRRLLERPALPAPAEVGSVLDRLERAWSLTLDAERQEHAKTRAILLEVTQRLGHCEAEVELLGNMLEARTGMVLPGDAPRVVLP